MRGVVASGLRRRDQDDEAAERGLRRRGQDEGMRMGKLRGWCRRAGRAAFGILLGNEGTRRGD